MKLIDIFFCKVCNMKNESVKDALSLEYNTDCGLDVHIDMKTVSVR